MLAVAIAAEVGYQAYGIAADLWCREAVLVAAATGLQITNDGRCSRFPRVLQETHPKKKRVSPPTWEAKLET